MDGSKKSRVKIATHSTMLMAYPGAALLRLTPGGLEPTTL
jgi:predicted ATPase